MASIADEVAALRGTRPASLKDLVTHGPFARLLAAMTVSSLGDWVGFVAVTSIVTRLGGGNAAIAISGVMIARTLPAFLFGPIAGVFVDRLDRKKLMIVADLARGALYVSMVFFHQLWMIYLLSFAIECLSLVWGPARDATLPNLVPRRQLANANSLGLVSTYGTLPLGGIVFTILVTMSEWMARRVPALGAQPESLALVMDAATFMFSASMLARVPIRSAVSQGRVRLDLSRVWRDTADGIRFLREDSIASAMTGGIVIAFGAVGAVLAIGPVFVANTIHAKTGFGIVVTAFGIGMALGMATSNQLAKVLERDIVFVWSLIAAAGTLFVLAIMPNLALASVVVVWLGAFCGISWVSGYTLLQENVADEYRGRTFGSLTTLSRMGLFLSLAIFPALAQVYDKLARKLVGGGDFYVGGQRFDLSGTRLALWTAGGVVVAAGLNTMRLLRRYRLSRPVPLNLVPKLKRPPATGLFIAFEGVEGAGKGTQIARAQSYLEEHGQNVLVTREPGGTPPGEQIRQVLLDPATGKLDPRAEALLFAASRAQTVAGVIRPALAEGKIVISDRYVDSSLAYQGWARGLGESDVLSLNVWATQGLFPDLVILLHVEPERGLLRSTSSPDRMELEGEDFHAKVADAYLKIAEEHPERFVVIEGDATPDEVFVHVREALERALRDRSEQELGTGG